MICSLNLIFFSLIKIEKGNDPRLLPHKIVHLFIIGLLRVKLLRILKYFFQSI